MKKLTFLTVLVSGFFLFAGNVLAQTFEFVPSEVTKNIGEEFTVTVNIDAGTLKTKGADLKITYDEDVLEIVDVEIGDYFPKGGYNDSNGTLYISYGNDVALETQSGSGSFAVVTLKGITSGEAGMEIACSAQTTDSNIWDEATNDIIDCDSITNPDFTIIESDTEDTVTATKTPTPTPPVSGITLPTFFGLGAGAILTVIGLALII